jgi:hypothetical protein
VETEGSEDSSCCTAYSVRYLKSVSTHERKDRATYLEKSDVRHDGSYDLDYLRIIVEQIAPILLERDTNYTVDQLIPSSSRLQLTNLLQAEKKILIIKLVRLAHLASHPLPAPSKFPVLTADAIPSEAGTWKKVLVVESKHD